MPKATITLEDDPETGTIRAAFEFDPPAKRSELSPAQAVALQIYEQIDGDEAPDPASMD